MKKRLLILLSVLLVMAGLCSCKSNSGALNHRMAKTVPEIDPAALITAEDVASVAGYMPVVEESETGRDGNVATVFYRSEPIGQHDIVKVKVTQFTESVTKDEISKKYEEAKSKRQSAEIVPSMGQETYIAFPSIVIYDRGCIIEITAGSGAGDEQKNLIKSFANIAAGRIEEMISE